MDDTIKKNICFGINEDKIDNLKLEKVIEISGIDEFINRQPNKLNTIIGHDGTRISEDNYKELELQELYI